MPQCLSLEEPSRNSGTNSPKEDNVQKLYSEFPGGCPGLGLLVLRLVTCGMLMTFECGGLAVIKATENHPIVKISLVVLLIAGGALVLAGFLTTIGSLVVGSIEAVWAMSSAIYSASDSTARWLYPLLIVGTLTALILAGPGGFSLDAYFFGPKRVDIPIRRQFS